MDFCLNPELLLAFVLTHLSDARLSAEFSFESDAQMRAGLFLSALVWPAGNNPGLYQETATTVKKCWNLSSFPNL